ncbi:hypothetical protein GGR07_000372 [Bacteroides pyogenes]|nr:hypothetical protein [Bacteroides pyogenes]SUV31790.1 Uncharacterised protein [Bacteroides pyogenes]
MIKELTNQKANNIAAREAFSKTPKCQNAYMTVLQTIT